MDTIHIYDQIVAFINEVTLLSVSLILQLVLFKLQ